MQRPIQLCPGVSGKFPSRLIIWHFWHLVESGAGLQRNSGRNCFVIKDHVSTFSGDVFGGRRVDQALHGHTEAWPCSPHLPYLCHLSGHCLRQRTESPGQIEKAYLRVRKGQTSLAPVPRASRGQLAGCFLHLDVCLGQIMLRLNLF